MENQDNDKSIKDNVLKAISSGESTMKPKWHFMVKASLLLIGIVFLILALLYLTSFIFFTLHQTGIWFVPGFGFRGVGIFFTSLPWILILVAALFIILLETLVKKYPFGYKKPLLYSVAGVVIIIVAGGILVERTSLHRGLFERARNGGLPVGGGFYRQFGQQRPPDNLAVGVVTEIIQNGYNIENQHGEITEIDVDDMTEYLTGTDIDVDDNIVVIGQHNGPIIKAYSIREIQDDDFPFPQHFREGYQPPKY